MRILHVTEESLLSGPPYICSEQIMSRTRYVESDDGEHICGFMKATAWREVEGGMVRERTSSGSSSVGCEPKKVTRAFLVRTG